MKLHRWIITCQIGGRMWVDKRFEATLPKAASIFRGYEKNYGFPHKISLLKLHMEKKKGWTKPCGN